MIELRSASKVYGHGAHRVCALRDVDLFIEEGQFVSVMGPSGSGKSTFLNLVSALDLPTSGQITIAGHDITRLDDDTLTRFRRRSIGLVFQFFNLLPSLDALSNVLLPVMFERKVNAADRARARQLLIDVGLEQRMHHRVQQLSGGEMQRVAIARALVLAPPLLLADEPTGSLDSRTGAAVLQLLRSLRSRHGTTVLMVTHDRRAAEVGDRIVSLRDGSIVLDEQLTPARNEAR